MKLSPDIPYIRRFDLFEVNLRSGELCQPGSKVRLRDQSLQILAFLLEHPGEVVTREQLRNQLWPDGVVVDYEHGINSAIKRLRKALGDDAEDPRFIETLPRHGYRFVAAVDCGAPVQDFHEGTELAARPGRWLAVAAIAAIAVFGALFALNVAGVRSRLLSSARASHGAPFPKIESIAVLPLENLSGNPEQEYFADGMTEELITDLGKISALRVISRTSVVRYKDARKPLPQIARELNVDAIVEGAVLRSGDRVRITAQLIDARADRHLWAQTYERDLRDVLSLQDEVAQAIASEIRIKLTSQEHAQLAGARPVNPQAYRLYLEGRYYFFKSTLPALEKSIQLFQRSLEKDPHFALAYAGLSESYVDLPFADFRALPRETFPKAMVAARKALEIDNTLAEAHAALGRVLFHYVWDWSATERELRRVIELKPSYALAHKRYAQYLIAMGRNEQAFAQIRRAQELDPVSPLMRSAGGWIYFLARRNDEAIEQCRKGLELDSNFAPAHLHLGFAYTGKGMYEEAITELDKSAALVGYNPALLRAHVYAVAGRRAEALKILEQLKPLQKRGEISPTAFFSLYAALGEKQKAIDILEKDYERREAGLVYLKVDPTVDPVRSDPRFQALLRRMNFPP